MASVETTHLIYQSTLSKYYVQESSERIYIFVWRWMFLFLFNDTAIKPFFPGASVYILTKDHVIV